MKLTYLGTAASEGIPAPFCQCPVCQRAIRRLVEFYIGETTIH